MCFGFLNKNPNLGYALFCVIIGFHSHFYNPQEPGFCGFFLLIMEDGSRNRTHFNMTSRKAEEAG